MPKTIDAGRYPAHAIAEIEAAKGKRRAELEAWWESWASVGDAKTAAQVAVDEWAAAGLAYAECRRRLEARVFPANPLPMACDHQDDRCAKAVTAKGKAVVKARDGIDRAIASHKAD